MTNLDERVQRVEETQQDIQRNLNGLVTHRHIYGTVVVYLAIVGALGAWGMAHMDKEGDLLRSTMEAERDMLKREFELAIREANLVQTSVLKKEIADQSSSLITEIRDVSTTRPSPMFVTGKDGELVEWSNSMSIQPMTTDALKAMGLLPYLSMPKMDDKILVVKGDVSERFRIGDVYIKDGDELVPWADHSKLLYPDDVKRTDE